MAKIVITSIADPVYRDADGWSGTVHVAVDIEMGAVNLQIPFASVPSLEHGLKAARKRLATFGEELSRAADQN